MSIRINICGTCCISRGDDGSSGSGRGCSRIRTLEITKCLQAGQALQFWHRLGNIVIAPPSAGDGAHNVNLTMSEGLRRFIFLRPAR